MAAMQLYCQLPFGRLNARTPEIKEFAGSIGRTASSVAMKLCNFASLDPQIIASGRKGLAGASLLDKQIWEEFHSNWEGSTEESAQALESFQSPERANPNLATPAFLPVIKTPSGPTFQTKTLIARRGQDFFRTTVLQSYQGRCAITGIPLPELLRASHILPWSSHESRRLDPSNGICLNALHDAAFDKFLLTFDEQFRLVLSPKLKSAFSQENWKNEFLPYEGLTITQPYRFSPDPQALAWHREQLAS